MTIGNVLSTLCGIVSMWDSLLIRFVGVVVLAVSWQTGHPVHDVVRRQTATEQASEGRYPGYGVAALAVVLTSRQGIGPAVHTRCTRGWKASGRRENW